MTNQDKYKVIREYWKDLYTEKPPTLDKAIWRIKESDKIYNALMLFIWEREAK